MDWLVVVVVVVELWLLDSGGSGVVVVGEPCS